MAPIWKRTGKSGVRWQARIRRSHQEPKSHTFSYKADAEFWLRETERSLERGTYNTNPIHETLSDLLIHYVDTVSVGKRGAEPERIWLMKMARHTVGQLPISQLRSFHFGQYRDQRLREVSPSTAKVVTRCPAGLHLLKDT